MQKSETGLFSKSARNQRNREPSTSRPASRAEFDGRPASLRRSPEGVAEPGSSRRNQAAPAKTPELSLRGCQFQLIGMRSEVTGDAETALEARAGALKLVPERTRRCSRWFRMFPLGASCCHVLIHQLEVEVQVGDRVPADVRANEPSEGVGRDWPVPMAARRRDGADPPLMPLQRIPPTEPSRSV